LKQARLEYLKKFDSAKEGPLHEQAWVKKELDKFDKEIYSLSQHFCENCHELWPSTEAKCTQCHKDPLKFSELNNMVPDLHLLPDEIKKDFVNLSMIEEMLISPLLAVMSIFRLPGGALVQRGFCANFAQDLTELTTTLPRLPKDIPFLILKKKDQSMNIKQFVVNRRRIENVLTYLCNNNQAYKEHNITIDYAALESLPEDGVPTDLNYTDDTEISNVDTLLVDTGPHVETNQIDNSFVENEQVEAFVEGSEEQPLQIDNIRTAINFPKANTKAINEFEFDSICSLLFPKLFPNGTADPTTKGLFFIIII
jgi:hypothetical protein